MGFIDRLRGRSTGYVPRDYTSVPEFSAFNEFSGPRIPRSEWKERIDYLNANKAQPYHWHRRCSSIKNQKNYGYCWMYGTVGAVMASYAIQGIDGLNLSAYAVASRGKNLRNEGGYGVEACRYIKKWGIPEESLYPEFSRSLDAWKKHEVIESAKQHQLVDFQELGSRDLDGVVSALIGPNPSPVTLALSWWGHLVVGLGVAYRGDEFGLIFGNSWGERYKEGGLDGGYGILWGKKAVPFESVVVRAVRARNE